MRATGATGEFNAAALTPGRPQMVAFDPTAPFSATLEVMAPAANAATPTTWWEIDPVNDLSDRRLTTMLEWNQGAPGFVTITTLSSVSTVPFVAGSVNQVAFFFDGVNLYCYWNGTQVGLAPPPPGSWPAAYMVIGQTELFSQTGRIQLVLLTQP